ncbi:MAG TPA: serine hydrolase [Pyrinomonadaceae bacterium]|nr:serine hydrolase [Pyrinomonadaceae bacterium]
MKAFFCKLLTLTLIFPVFALGQSQTNLDAEIRRVEQGLLPPVLIKGDPAWTIEERMKFYKAPGLSVAVIKDFKIHWARSYGVKDLETKEPVTTETLFQAGSISKSVNAMVAMKKVEQGKISLDANINDKLTTWKLPENDFTAKKKVTLKNLLSHTAGTTVHGFPGYAVNETVPTLVQVLDGAKPANTAAVRVDVEPGTRYRYSGGGTTITQLALMDIEKKPYPEIARETVLKPLKMTNSTYSQPLPASWRPKAATGYRRDGKEVEGKIHVYPEMAAAGLWTTPTDLAKFAIEMQLSLAGRSNKVLSKESTDLMTTAFMDTAGLGFFIQKFGSALYFGHDGADEGFRAQMVVSRDKGYGVVVMVNSDNGAILNEVVRAVAREYGWDEYLPAPHEIISMNAEKLEGYTGRFLINPDRVLTVKTEPGEAGKPAKLFVYATGDERFELLPISDTTFVRRGVPLKYEFSTLAVEGINLNGSSVIATSLKVIPQSGTPLKVDRLESDRSVPFEMLEAGRIDEAIEAYRKIKKEQPANVAVSVGRINSLAYVLMRAKRLKEAIAMFKLNVEFYPALAGVYDSLGEGYMTNGDKELAIANYRKALELDPRNKNAQEKLKQLEGR